MIVVRIQGGLGNQMFQYAAGFRLAHRHATTLHLDLSWFGKRPQRATERKYALDAYPLRAAIDGADMVRAAALGIGGRAGRIIMGARAQLGSCRLHVIEQTGSEFRPDVLAAPDNTYLLGYWQGERYFADVAEEVRSTFTMPSNLSARAANCLTTISQVQAVSLHVRRGDYVTRRSTAGFHGALSPDYYERAVSRIRRAVDNPHLFIFSDDLGWCKEHLNFQCPTSFVNPGEGTLSANEDMHLIAACQHHIIANSTFSWWGAWLGSHPLKTVIAPRAWYRAPAPGAEDLYCKGWLTV